MIGEACEREGVAFVEIEAPDPSGGISPRIGLSLDNGVYPDDEDGVENAKQFIAGDVPRQVAEYGPDTAFFSTNCAVQDALIKSVAEAGAIYPQPCCPSPYHGFPAALDIADRTLSGLYDGGGDAIMTLRSPADMIGEIASALARTGVAGRFASQPLPPGAAWTAAGAEYAVRRLNGEAPQGRADPELFAALCSEFIYEQTGIDAGARARPLAFDGIALENYILASMGYITF